LHCCPGVYPPSLHSPLVTRTSPLPILFIPMHLQMPNLQALYFQINANCPGGVPPCQEKS
jgi:hypothetical protein